ncbi:cytochrome P450 [Trametes meyenii]|nr:cytochrome P450 [Trametes meyenii]
MVWPSLSIFVALVCICTVLFIRKATEAKRTKLPFPPGPRGLPLIGNALDIPSKDVARVFRKMSARYGDIMYLEAFGQPMIVLGTQEAAVDLLEKRSAKYADKPRSVMAYLAGWDWVLPAMPYGPWWRRSRRAFHEFFNPGVIEQYRPIQLEGARRLLPRLVKDPRHFPDHIRHAIGLGIMRITYGIDIEKERTTPYMAVAAETMETFAATFMPGKYLVETFPVLRFLPSWMPGAAFKRDAKLWRPIVQRLRDTPWNATMAAMKDGTAPPSIVAAMVERAVGLEGKELEEEIAIAKDTASAAYAGGADTLFSTTMTFFLAMAKYPDVQENAQAELDAVVGPRRLPDFADQPALPYLSALMKECMRWRVVLPLGLMHYSMEDDYYRGYYIPKGTLMVPNAWAYTRDARHYPDPEEFKPERYLKDGKINHGVLDPGSVAFGYGRRGCPGRDFSEAILFALMSTVLHTLTIAPVRDEQGRPLPPEGRMTDGGVLSLPEPFECDIKPRSLEAEGLISSVTC